VSRECISHHHACDCREKDAQLLADHILRKLPKEFNCYEVIKAAKRIKGKDK
jgi:hypothetical protein